MVSEKNGIFETGATSVRKMLQGALKLYTAALSPLLGVNKCRFYPSCSSYAVQALDRHGVLKGLFLTIGRFIRCHPWSRHNFCDPVPERFDWRDIISYKRSTIPKNEAERP